MNTLPAFLRHARYVVTSNGVTAMAFGLFALLLTAAIAGPWLAPHPPLATNASMALQPPSATHWFGTDVIGRDIFSRVLVATRIDLMIASSSVMLAATFGLVLGLLAGWYGGMLDRVVGRVVDTIMAFPLFVLAMGIVAALGNTLANVVLAMAIINLPFYLRVARAETNVRRSSGMVEAARISGGSDARILLVHLLPNILPSAMVQLSLGMGMAILNCAALSFIGLGVRPPEAEWGILVAEGSQHLMSGEWWVALFPGLALMLAVFCFNLLGDGLRDLIDPRQRT